MSEGVQQYQNSLHSKFFPNFGVGGWGGGVHRKSIFSQIQKSPKYPRGGGGSRKLWTFSTNYGIFYFEPSPKKKRDRVAKELLLSQEIESLEIKVAECNDNTSFTDINQSLQSKKEELEQYNPRAPIY